MNRILGAALAFLAISLAPACGQVSNSETGVANTNDGGRVFYETSGNPSGEPLLMIHGAAVAASFHPLMNEAALSDYFLVRYHRQGYSGSSYPEVGGRERESADALAVLDELGIEKAHVAGHSAGGPIALWLARYQPDRVQSVILIESPRVSTVSDQGMSAQEAREAEDQRFAFARNNPARNSVGQILGQWWGDDWAVEAPSMIPGVIEQTRADLNNYWVDRYVFTPYPDDFFVNLAKPVIYLVKQNPGENENIGISTLAEKIPGMVTRPVVGVPNHGFQMVAPEPTARAIAKWLAENPFD